MLYTDQVLEIGPYDCTAIENSLPFKTFCCGYPVNKEIEKNHLTSPKALQYSAPFC